MEIRSIPIDQLKPAPYNPRISLQPGSPAYRRLERSLDEFSLVQPIVWNEQTGHVVGGHQRLRILKDKGIDEVDAVVVSLSLEREKALNIALNNSQVAGDWDAGKLIGVMSELNGLPDFDATLTGFDAGDINDILMTPAQEIAPETEAPAEKDVVELTIEIPNDRWEELRPEFDTIIARLNLTVHVKFPQQSQA